MITYGALIMCRFAFLCFMGLATICSFFPADGATKTVAIIGKTTSEKQLVASFASDLLKIIENKAPEREQFQQLCSVLSKYFDLKTMSKICLARHYSEMVRRKGEAKVVDVVTKILGQFCLSLFKSTGSDKNATCSVTRAQKRTIKQGGIETIKRSIYVTVKANAKTYEIIFVVEDGKITDAKSENVSMCKTVHDQLNTGKLTWKKLQQKAQFNGQTSVRNN